MRSALIAERNEDKRNGKTKTKKPGVNKNKREEEKKGEKRPEAPSPPVYFLNFSLPPHREQRSHIRSPIPLSGSPS